MTFLLVFLALLRLISVRETQDSHRIQTKILQGVRKKVVER